MKLACIENIRRQKQHVERYKRQLARHRSGEDISLKSQKTFRKPKQEKHLKSFQVYKDVLFDEFLDKSKKLQKLTNQILKVLSQVWESPK
ncbi:23969_t:CDS:2 [Cetraspora pellucida]|uniref:23969_t:CDS:1 n=1 Tax=Cetraspora pellucida TaxID=1433469 RepID=A0A9N9JCA6_9GLOM|nr:23969_t:CDS:2 [Cetraspora pellucida]